MTWGRVRAPHALDQLLTGLGGASPAAETTGTTVAASAVTSTASPDGFDSASFGWGAATAALVAGTLGLALRRRRAARA